ALGNIYSGQILAAIEQAVPGWRSDLERGSFQAVKEWLSQNVHKPGNLYDPSELIKQITGNEVSVGPYLNYLNEKYSRLYRF
ncbi:MAG: hypothetical protein PHU23_14405, partial [Dehalococcoidales bacterium]|nr:hypothetical protein [Dehalococcoidales bacterium]